MKENSSEETYPSLSVNDHVGVRVSNSSESEHIGRSNGLSFKQDNRHSIEATLKVRL